MSAIAMFRQLSHVEHRIWHMSRFHRLHLLALCGWEVTVLGILLILLLVMRPNRTWDKGDLVFLAYVAVCGVLVTAAIAFVSRPFGRVGSVVTGILCGLAPSVFLFSWVLVTRPGFEASAGTAGVAMILAAPSAVGGAIAGLVCSWQRRAPQPDNC